VKISFHAKNISQLKRKDLFQNPPKHYIQGKSWFALLENRSGIVFAAHYDWRKQCSSFKQCLILVWMKMPPM